MNSKVFETFLPLYSEKDMQWLRRGLSRTKIHNGCCLTWFIPHSQFNQDVGEVTKQLSFKVNVDASHMTLTDMYAVAILYYLCIYF